jgi:hypothetical protein
MFLGMWPSAWANTYAGSDEAQLNEPTCGNSSDSGAATGASDRGQPCAHSQRSVPRCPAPHVCDASNADVQPRVGGAADAYPPAKLHVRVARLPERLHPRVLRRHLRKRQHTCQAEAQP